MCSSCLSQEKEILELYSLFLLNLDSFISRSLAPFTGKFGWTHLAFLLFRMQQFFSIPHYLFFFPKDECQNYIRVLAQTDRSNLLVCGTNSFNPKCRTYSTSHSQENTVEDEGDQRGGEEEERWILQLICGFFNSCSFYKPCVENKCLSKKMGKKLFKCCLL